MNHTILYFGHFDRNFQALNTETTTYRDKDNLKKPVEQATKNVTGYHFRYMERQFKEFVAVGVEDVGERGIIILRAPLLLTSERHTDEKGFFNGPHFGDESAMHLLVDMIVANPEYRDALGRLVRQLGLPT